MDSFVFEHLVADLQRIGSAPDWVLCADLDILRDFRPAERRRLLKRAKQECTRRAIQERVDEIAEAVEFEDDIMVQVLLEAFPKDLELHKSLSPVQKQRWIEKANAAANGVAEQYQDGEPIIYFLAGDDGFIKIGFTTNLRKRLRSLRTGSPKQLRIRLTIPGTRDDERELHRRFAAHQERGEWFRLAEPIADFIADHQQSFR